MRNLVLVLAAAVVLSAGQNAFAYDPDALDYSFGSIQSVSATEITLEEYDFEGDLENTLQVTYVINPETEMDNFGAIEDLKVGEDVEIYFVEENGQKIAISLAKDEGLEEDLSLEAEYNGEDVVTMEEDISDVSEPAN